ncbi:hypothetical protein ACFO4P_08450 [Epilithonimonas pallida]|uniref:Trypsin-like peptidase domain-containing protein n=1 Tax=Epilithonimonas pallida TaxID=373671 RepID=A0ABY1R4H0_9FLAO|nr:hypothetical protein [Epilithonimonas pallida]SMP93794.1 hypothetical protein SAMN05421679_10599 [Epilithonimonas pallida]
MKKNIQQLAAVKISSNKEVSTAVIYFPDPDVDYVYVLTAKHCLTGKNFDKEIIKTGIVLDEIFNEETSTFHSYTLVDTDIVLVSESDEEDMALLILPKEDIISLTGKQFFCQVIDTNQSIDNYQIRGFASFNNQDKDRYFPLKFNEDEKAGPQHFSLRSEEPLDTFDARALENVSGLSGSGAYSILYDNAYLTGIIDNYEDKDIFIATKVFAYNVLLNKVENFLPITLTVPETNEEVVSSYSEMEKNEKKTIEKTNETVGDFNVPRDNTKLLQSLKNNNLIVVHGKPGVGKSALTKSAVSTLKLSGDHTILTFTAENLYCETLSEALKNSGCNASMEQILDSPLSNKYFLFWIESFEKLLESGKFGAFKELLQLLNKNKHAGVVLTMRDYLIQNFRINFYTELPGNISYLQVDEFDDQEIAMIRERFPELNSLLDNPKINHLLRTPYYLDKALRILPVLSGEEALDEKQFKMLMWKHIVENNSTKRGNVFFDICVKRAIEMTLFTTYAADEEITNELVRDNILQFDNTADEPSFCPSHDMLEDWALIRYIRKQKYQSASAKEFLLKLGVTPSQKRAFRLWMEELYISEPDKSISFVHELLNDPELSQAWKDDLLIVSLRSNHSNVILDSLKDQLLNNSGNLIQRIIFLLQTGCKKMDPTKRDFDHLLPVGNGWDYIINFIKDNFSELIEIPGFETKYLTLIVSWSAQLKEFNQDMLPSGAKSAAFLLEDFIYRSQAIKSTGYFRKADYSYLKIYLDILFKLTEADPVLVGNLIQSCVNPQEADTRWTNQVILSKVRNYIINGLTSDQICRFFPDEVLKMATEKWAKKVIPRSTGRSSDWYDKKPKHNDFGLDKDLDYDYEFPSGYYTFFYWMFLYHPVQALDFIVPFLNTAFDYNWKILSADDDGLEEIKIKFENGTEKMYYGTTYYWSMYRGFNVDNRVLTSLLMGLEKSLLDLGEKDLKTVQNYLKRLILESNNVAVLGIVSSVIQAYPSVLDEYSVSLLGIPIFFEWDSSRSTSEMIDVSFYPDDDFEKRERITENNRFHRKKYYVGLVGFVAHYIFYERKFNHLLFKQIDAMWENLHQDNIGFKKFLFDMDARKYAINIIEEEGENNLVQLSPGYDAETMQMVNSFMQDEYPSINATWARNAYDNVTMSNHNYETWKKGYEFILRLEGKPHFMVTPVTMAAVALRDFAHNLSPDELSWCCETVVNLGESKLLDKDAYPMNLDMVDSGPGLRSLSYIFKYDLDGSFQLKVKELLFRLLLKGIDERDRFSLLAGISHDLPVYQPEFVKNCWFGLLEFIRIQKELNQEYKRKKAQYHREEITLEQLNEANQDWFEKLVMSVLSGTITAPETNNISLDMATHWFLDDAVRMIPWKTNVPAHHQFIQEILQMHLEYLNDQKVDSYSDYHDSRSAFIFFYPRYLLNQPLEFSKPLFSSILYLTLSNEQDIKTDKFQQFISKLIKEFILARGIDLGKFWILWEVLKDWSLKNRNGKFFPFLLLDIDWKESEEKCSFIEGRQLFYKDLITNWGFNRINSSIRFLNGIAFYNYMPESISWIALMLKTEKSVEADYTLLNNYIEKAFYKYGAKIKRNRSVLKDFLFILDFLIEKSSTKAYMLKDEFLQYK